MLILFFLILGAVVGSFLGVIAYRVPKKESIVFPASHCPHCRHKLLWYDLIPIVSYLSLLGKCRYCRKPISFVTLAVEIWTSLLFALIYIFFPGVHLIQLIYYLAIGSIFTVIFFTDYMYGIIPFQISIIGFFITFFYLLFSYSPSVVIVHLFSAIGAFLSFLFLFLITRGKGMGFGDVILVALMGILLGFPDIIFALYIAFLTGAIMSGFLILIGRKKLKNDSIPFGPFLVIGTLASFFYGTQILNLVRYYLPL